MIFVRIYWGSTTYHILDPYPRRWDSSLMESHVGMLCGKMVLRVGWLERIITDTDYLRPCRTCTQVAGSVRPKAPTKPREPVKQAAVETRCVWRRGCSEEGDTLVRHLTQSGVWRTDLFCIGHAEDTERGSAKQLRLQGLHRTAKTTPTVMRTNTFLGPCMRLYCVGTIVQDDFAVRCTLCGRTPAQYQEKAWPLVGVGSRRQ